MKRTRVRELLAAGMAVAWAAGCGSPTVTLATDKPIEIKIDLRHEVRVHIDREIDELIDEEDAPVRARGVIASDEEIADAAKTRGALGEQADGYLAVREAKPDSADRRLADRVNARRREAYVALAEQAGVPLPQVEKTAGANRIEDAKPGEWVRTPDGEWIQKDEQTVVLVEDRSGN